jgi:hypothetical protein
MNNDSLVLQGNKVALTLQAALERPNDKEVVERLREYRHRYGFRHALCQIACAGSNSVTASVRLLAAIMLKNAVRGFFSHVSMSGTLRESEQALVKQMLLPAVEEAAWSGDARLTRTLAITVAAIARYDWPARWPALLPTLLRLVAKSHQNANAQVCELIAQYAYFHVRRAYSIPWDMPSLATRAAAHTLLSVFEELSTRRLRRHVVAFRRGARPAVQPLCRMWLTHSFTTFHFIAAALRNACADAAGVAAAADDAADTGDGNCITQPAMARPPSILPSFVDDDNDGSGGGGNSFLGFGDGGNDVGGGDSSGAATETGAARDTRRVGECLEHLLDLTRTLRVLLLYAMGPHSWRRRAGDRGDGDAGSGDGDGGGVEMNGMHGQGGGGGGGGGDDEAPHAYEFFDAFINVLVTYVDVYAMIVRVHTATQQRLRIYRRVCRRCNASVAAAVAAAAAAHLASLRSAAAHVRAFVSLLTGIANACVSKKCDAVAPEHLVRMREY